MNTEYIINQLQLSKSDLTIACNDGSVSINPNTFDFTYWGQFGSRLLSSITRLGINNDPAYKIVALAAHMEQYAKKCGGFSYTTK